MFVFSSNFRVISLVVIPLALLVISCKQVKQGQVSVDNQEPATQADLGKLLFFDPILSSNQKISCASCHKPEYAFADNVPFSFGVDSLLGGRNTPSAMNQSDRSFFFHDGRAETLEQQALGPIENPVEMNLPIAEAIKRLNQHAFYRKQFKRLYGQAPNKENLANALASFERTLETAQTKFDTYASGDTSVFNASEARGLRLFRGKAKCFDCHFGPDFTGDDFKNIGLFNGSSLNDSGRFVVTKNPKDIGRFKVPGLRNVAITAPYMHNGSMKTLEEVIRYYNQPQIFHFKSVNMDTSLAKPLNLTAQELKDIEAFLHTLTDKQFLATNRN